MLLFVHFMIYLLVLLIISFIGVVIDVIAVTMLLVCARECHLREGLRLAEKTGAALVAAASSSFLLPLL